MNSPFFKQLFPNKKPIIAMLHVFQSTIDKQGEQALEDLFRLQPYVDGVIVENYGFGYLDNNLATDDIFDRLEILVSDVVKYATIPVGINVLPNDYMKAFQLCEKTGARFIQLDHVTGDFVGCQSVDPQDIISLRLKYPDVVLLGGVHPKYYTLVNPDTSIAASAALAKLLTDAVVVTGEFTGGETNVRDLCSAKMRIGSHPLIIGSGLTAENAIAQLSIADGAIVGTAFKKNSVIPGEPIDVEMVKRLMDEVQKLR